MFFNFFTLKALIFFLSILFFANWNRKYVVDCDLSFTQKKSNDNAIISITNIDHIDNQWPTYPIYK